MSVVGVTRAGRRAAEATMLDTATVTRAGTGDGTFDPATGVTTPPAATTVYGPGQKCRLRAPTLQERAATAGEHQWTSQDAVLSLPATETGVQVGDLAEITGSELDPALPGTTHVVMAVLKGSQVTARRLIVREVTS